MLSIENDDIIRRLRALSDNDSAATGFRRLCAAAQVCSNCCLPWGPPDFTCSCTPSAKETKP